MIEVLITAALALSVLGAGAYLVWNTHPAWIISIAVALSVFAGHWENMGVPGPLAPERLLLLAGIAGVLLRAPPIRDRPALRIEWVHWLLIAAGLYAVVSALFAGTLTERADFLALVQTYGLLPFAVFFVMPAAFQEARHRRVLLGALVILGGYLGVTALLETIGPRALVYPAYILDPSVGIHVGRARGPFAEAVSNGVGLFACAIAAGLALVYLRSGLARAAAFGVIVLCAIGLLFTLQRSIWLATVATVALVLVAVRDLRKFVVPVTVGGGLVVAIALTSVPGLEDKASQRGRQERTVWERQNQIQAAVNMINAHPAFGVGWARFPAESVSFFELGDDIPLVGAGGESHNVYFRYASELGLVGFALWLAATLAALLGGLLRRGPPELAPWRVALGAYALFYGFVAAFVPPQAFPPLVFWVLAGVVWVRSEPTPGHKPTPLSA